MRKLLRTAQVQLPWVRDLKHEMQHLRCALTRSPFERDFRLLASFRPPRGQQFVDVGANRGQSVQAIRLAHPDAPIVCFEPASESFSRLRRRLRGDAAVRIRRCALGAEDGKLRLYTPCYNGYVFDGLASTIAAEAAGWLNPDRLYFFSPSRLRLRDEVVSMRRLDDFALEPCFLKIDVQGGELDVLRGGERTIDTHRPIILLEAPREDREIAFLRPLGYDPYAFDGIRLEAGLSTDRNTFLIPEDRRSQLDVEVRDGPAPVLHALRSAASSSAMNHGARP